MVGLLQLIEEGMKERKKREKNRKRLQFPHQEGEAPPPAGRLQAARAAFPPRLMTRDGTGGHRSLERTPTAGVMQESRPAGNDGKGTDALL